jgi:hypothetical protein
LSIVEQLALLETIVLSMKAKQRQVVDRHIPVDQVQGCLKRGGQPIITDGDIGAMREERLMEKVK